MIERIRDQAAQRQAFHAALESRQDLKPSSEDPSRRDHCGFCTERVFGHDAILQSPKPFIVLSTRILQRAAEHDVEPEVGS